MINFFCDEKKMAIKKEDLEFIRKKLDESARPLFYFDDDPDGLSSFLLLYRYKKDGYGVIVKGSPELEVQYAEKINEYGPTDIFILDKPLVSQEFIDKAKTPMIWIDHHAPVKRSNITYFNPRIADDKDNLPTSYWAYQIVKDEDEKDLWIAMCGIVGDWFLPRDVAVKFSEQHPELLDSKITSPEEALFHTKIGELSKIFSFILKGNTKDVMKYVKILTRIESPQEILLQQSSRARLIYKRYEQMNITYKKILSNVPKPEDNVILFIYEEQKVSFTAELSNELLHLNPECVIIIGRKKGDEVKLSFRSKKYDLPAILEKALVGINGYGGGHKAACGGCIKQNDFERFLQQFKEEIKK